MENKRHYDFRDRNNHCRTVTYKIDTSATSLPCCMKFNGIECSEKLYMTVDFFVLVAFITQTWIRAYIWFSIISVRIWPLWKIAILCSTDTKTLVVTYSCHLGDWYTGLSAQTLVHQNFFLMFSFFSCISIKNIHDHWFYNASNYFEIA